MKQLLFYILILISISTQAQVPNTPERCKAITSKGTQCTRLAKIDGYCKQHYKSISSKKISVIPQEGYYYHKEGKEIIAYPENKIIVNKSVKPKYKGNIQQYNF
jgi:hypothetical protein